MEDDLNNKRQALKSVGYKNMREKSQKAYLNLYKKIFKFSENHKYDEMRDMARKVFFIMDDEKVNERFASLFTTYCLFDYYTLDGKNIALEYANLYKSNKISADDYNNAISVIASYLSIYTVVKKDLDGVVLKDEISKSEVLTYEFDVLKDIEVGESVIGRLANISGVNLLVDIIVKIPENTKDFIINDVKVVYEHNKDSYSSLVEFAMYNTYIFYRYIQQLIDVDVSNFMNDKVKSNSQTESGKDKSKSDSDIGSGSDASAKTDEKTSNTKESAKSPLESSKSSSKHEDAEKTNDKEKTDSYDGVREKLEELGDKSYSKRYDEVLGELQEKYPSYSAQTATIAAVIDYVVRNEVQGVTQKAISDIFGISASTLGKNYREVKKYIEV